MTSTSSYSQQNEQENIENNLDEQDESLTPIPLLLSGCLASSSKDYCHLFESLVTSIGIKVRRVKGFVKGFDYRPGYKFTPGVDQICEWNLIYLMGNWRFLDVTLASGYRDHSGVFVKKLNEHYFLTDPEIMIWTHFPLEVVSVGKDANLLNDPAQPNMLKHPTDGCYWQLLEGRPFFLEEFNALPKVTPAFFDLSLRIRGKITECHPISFRIQTEVKLSSHEPMRFKYKLYPMDEAESSSMNHYVFCQLKEERLLGCFTVSPPMEGKYYLKVCLFFKENCCNYFALN